MHKPKDESLVCDDHVASEVSHRQARDDYGEFCRLWLIHELKEKSKLMYIIIPRKT